MAHTPTLDQLPLEASDHVRDEMTDAETKSLDGLLRRIAVRMAAGVQSQEDILKDEGLDPEDFDHVQKFPVFHQYFAEAHEAWARKIPLEKRIRMQAAESMRGIVAGMARLATTPNATPAARVSAAGFVADIAGMSTKAQALTGASVGVAVSVNIDLTAGHSHGTGEKMLLSATPVITPHEAGQATGPIEYDTDPPFHDDQDEQEDYEQQDYEQEDIQDAFSITSP